MAASTTRAATRGIVQRHVLGRRVADPGRVAHEQHRRRQPRGQHAGVVAGEADVLGHLGRRRRPRRRVPSAARSPGIELLAVRARGDRDLDLRRRVRCASCGRGVRAAPSIQACSCPGGRRCGRRSTARTSEAIVVAALGSTWMRAVVTVSPGEREPQLVGGHDQPRRGGQRVAALLARGRAGVVGPPAQRHLEPDAAGQGADHRDRHTGAVHGRGLVDVDLDEAAQARQPAGASASPIGIHARPPASPRPAPCRARRARQHGREIEAPGQRLGAEGRRVEARALLVGERDHGHRLARGGGDLKPAGHAERAVEAPAPAHAVQMRAHAPPRRVARSGRPTGCPPGRAARAQPSSRPPGASNQARQAASSGVQARRWTPCVGDRRSPSSPARRRSSEAASITGRATSRARRSRAARRPGRPPTNTTATGLCPRR